MVDHSCATATAQEAAESSRSGADSGAPTSGPVVRAGVRMGVRMGVDVGSVRVGVAVSDPGAVLALPVETVPRGDPGDPGDHRTDDGDHRTDDRGPTHLTSDLARLVELAREREVVEVVVGLPRSLSGAETAAASAARAYATRLASVLPTTPVRLVDERLTTVDAHRRLRESGVAGRAQRAVVDQAAAVLILQSALDAERASGQAPGELLRDTTTSLGRARKARARRPGRPDPGRTGALDRETTKDRHA